VLKVYSPACAETGGCVTVKSKRPAAAAIGQDMNGKRATLRVHSMCGLASRPVFSFV